mmetsp:Transcript_22162/g.46638  ORF Transcript_22162/g.46638 Transcript_22162/m.46638 type:complete len:231 (-) Transcript_22162:2095-2787(-)
MLLEASASDVSARLLSRAINVSSRRCIVFNKSLVRYFTLAKPLASRTPPLAVSEDAYISITEALIDASRTTHAPPRISAKGGMKTKTGCSYATKASTIRDPYFKTSSNISRWPPLNPRQLAKTIRGKSSVRKSLMAWAVLYALFGNQTQPASWITASEALTSAGSAGLIFSAVRFSVMTTPIGIPPRRALPTTTDLAHPARVSLKLPLSKNPLCHTPLSFCAPARSARGS